MYTSDSSGKMHSYCFYHEHCFIFFLKICGQIYSQWSQLATTIISNIELVRKTVLDDLLKGLLEQKNDSKKYYQRGIENKKNVFGYKYNFGYKYHRKNGPAYIEFNEDRTVKLKKYYLNGEKYKNAFTYIFFLYFSIRIPELFQSIKSSITKSSTT
jgi:hypothetical protein